MGGRGGGGSDRESERDRERHTDRHRQSESDTERERERMEDSVKNIQEYTDIYIYINESIVLCTDQYNSQNGLTQTNNYGQYTFCLHRTVAVKTHTYITCNWLL